MNIKDIVPALLDTLAKMTQIVTVVIGGRKGNVICNDSI